MAKDMEETKMKYSIAKPVESVFTESRENEEESESADQPESQEEPTLEKLNDEIRKLRKHLLSEQQSSTTKISVLNESLETIKIDNSEKEQHLVALKEQITKDQSKIMREIQAKVWNYRIKFRKAEKAVTNRLLGWFVTIWLVGGLKVSNLVLEFVFSLNYSKNDFWFQKIVNNVSISFFAIFLLKIRNIPTYRQISVMYYIIFQE